MICIFFIKLLIDIANDDDDDDDVDDDDDDNIHGFNGDGMLLGY